MINWILQKNLTKAAILDRIKSALNGIDESWEEVEIIPFSNQIPELQRKGAFHIIYGSTTLMLLAAEKEELQAGLFFDPRKFQMNHYVDKWQERVLNHDGYLMPFGELDTLKSPAGKLWFIRPNSDGKAFSGRVATIEELIQWSKEICQLHLPELNQHTKVWISTPKKIDKEWRLFVVDDRIISASRYMDQGELAESAVDIPDEMMSFAQSLIKDYRLSDVYVMDIALSAGQYKLIECNCFNGTGFYEHDVEGIIRAVNGLIKWKLNNYSA